MSAAPKRAKKAKKLAEPISCPVPNFGAARYLYKLGFVVTDDVIQNAAKNGALPLEGALVVRLKKPVPCVFISFGLCGIALPDTGGLCAIGDSWNYVTKEERFALSSLMVALDSERTLNLRMQWYLIDMKEADARVLKNPTDMELTKLFRTPAAMKCSDLDRYKLVARVSRRRTTAGADLTDGHEGDSDQDPMMVYLNEMIEKEERSEKARRKKLGSFPDTPMGWKLAKLYNKSAFKTKKVETPDKEEGEELTEKEKEEMAKYRAKKRPRTFYPPRSTAPKRKRISYNADPDDTRGTEGPIAGEHASLKREDWDRRSREAAAARELFGESSEDDQSEAKPAATASAQPASETTATDSISQQPPPQNTNQGGQQSAHSDCEQEDLPTEEETFRSSDEDGEGDGVGADYEDG